MLWKRSHAYWLVVLIGLAAGIIAWRFAFFWAPFAWTGEPPRLARALGLQTGMQIADIGAGSGALAVAMAALVGSTGRVYATELEAEQRLAIQRRVSRDALSNVQIVAAEVTQTGLPDACCEAVYMRAVFHHISDRSRFAADLSDALRHGGRVGVIDFAPRTLWFHGSDHGVQPEAITSAFQASGFRLLTRVDDWGGGMFLLVFERPPQL